MKRMTQVLAILLALALLLTACNTQKPAQTQPKETQGTQKPAETQPKETEPAALDLSNVEIDAFLVKPWVKTGMPANEDDVVADYIEENFGGRWHLTIASEGITELVTRCASGEEPDVMILKPEEVDTIYEQGVLLEDWSAFADKIPNRIASMGEAQTAFFTTEEGYLKAISYAPGGQNWTFLIRQDWLDALNLPMPTTPEELLNVMRAFTYDDPDGNGKDDTYGYSCATRNGSGDNDLAELLILFDNFLMAYEKDGKATNAIVEGTYKQFLDFVKTIVSEGLVNPDWYTLGREDRKPALYQGQYGVIYYPPTALLSETISGLGLSEDPTGEAANAIGDRWAVLGTLGGKAEPATPLADRCIVVSAKCAEDPAKMQAICNFLEGTASFNEHYANVRFFVDAYGEEARGWEATEDSYYQWTDTTKLSQEKADYFNTYNGLPNWGMMVNHYSGNLFTRNGKEVAYYTQKSWDMNTEFMGYDRWSNFGLLLNIDATLTEEVTMDKEAYFIKYIIGEVSEDSYDDFVKDWLADGGQEYLDLATEGFEKLGVFG